MLVRKDALRASKAMQQRVFDNQKIEILRNTEGEEIIGDEKMMTGIVIKNNQTNEEMTLEAGGLFYGIGHTPNTGFLDGQIELDETGYVITKPGTTVTNVAGFFAAGDVQDKKYRQAVTSAGT